MTKIENPFLNSLGRREQRQAKRDALLRAAAHMFNERGFHATSLDDVAAHLGITKPTIYHYLGNKEAVLLECLSIGLNLLLEAATEARKTEGNGAAQLEHFLRRYAEINMDDFGRVVIRTGVETLSPDGATQFQQLKRKIDDALRELVDQGIADGSVVADNPKLLAFTLAGALNWPARWFVPDGEMKASEVAHEMVRILAAGFAPRPQ